MRIRRLVTAMAGFCLLTSAAHAGDWLTGEQIQTLISGNTTYGRHAKKDRHSFSYNREDGTFVGWSSA